MFSVKYELNVHILFRINSVCKGLMGDIARYKGIKQTGEVNSISAFTPIERNAYKKKRKWEKQMMVNICDGDVMHSM